MATLKAALRTRHVPHAWLFAGPEGVGKELAAVGLAQALTCPEKPFEGCGACECCTRVAKRSHPDVTWVMPEDELVLRGWAGRSDFAQAPSRDIRVEQIRRLQERLAFRPLEAPHKVVLIVTAHAMNSAAQNALLKTLEEPPANTFLVLVSSAPFKLLPTIRSRCAQARFGPLPKEVLVAQVQATRGVDRPAAERVAAMAQGSLSQALALDPAELATQKALIEGFEALKASDARPWLALAEQWGQSRESAEAALDVLATWFRDVACAQVGSHRLLHADQSVLAIEAAGKVMPAKLLRRAELVDEARNAIVKRNGAARLQLERMLIEMFSARS